VIEEQPTDHRAEGDAESARRGPQANGLLPLAALAEQVGDDRQRGRHDQRRPDTHAGARGDEDVHRPGERRPRRSRSEEQHTGQEHALAAPPVAEAAGNEQQAGKDQDVGVDDPLQVGRRRVESAHQGRQRDVEDRVVQRDQQQRHAQHREGRSPPNDSSMGGRHQFGAHTECVNSSMGRRLVRHFAPHKSPLVE
jgi:hypothetical protein